MSTTTQPRPRYLCPVCQAEVERTSETDRFGFRRLYDYCKRCGGLGYDAAIIVQRHADTTVSGYSYHPEPPQPFCLVCGHPEEGPHGTPCEPESHELDLLAAEAVEREIDGEAIDELFAVGFERLAAGL